MKKLALLLLHIICINQLANAQTWPIYKIKYGTISFSYPPGWYAGVDDDKKNAFSENCHMQPQGQVFNAQNGQVIIRTFDPVYVMEKSGALACTFSLTLFNKFTSLISEGVAPQAIISYYNEVAYYKTIQNNQGYQVETIGYKSPNGNLYVLMAAAAPYVSKDLENVLLYIASSMKGGEPNRLLTTQESVVKNWYSSLAAGNKIRMDQLSCTSANQMNTLVDLAGLLLGVNGSSAIIIGAARSFNFSHLQYYAIAGNDNVTAVRVCGNIIDPYGNAKSFYDYAHTGGGTNIFVVRNENGQWKLCESLR